MIPKRRAGDGWIERRPAQPGLLRAAVLRLLREAAFGGAALAMALGLAAWVTDFDLAAWTNPASANIGSTTSFDERFGPGSVRRSLAVNYPWRPAPFGRSNFDAEFGHIESQLGGQSPRRSRMFSPRRPPRRSRRQSRCHEPGRSWPIFSHREERSGAGFV